MHIWQVPSILFYVCLYADPPGICGQEGDIFYLRAVRAGNTDSRVKKAAAPLEAAAVVLIQIMFLHLHKV